MNVSRRILVVLLKIVLVGEVKLITSRLFFFFFNLQINIINLNTYFRAKKPRAGAIIL